MPSDKVEHLPYQGQAPADRFAYERYRNEVSRGKSLLQLKAVQQAVTPEIHRSWSPRTFTPVQTPEGLFDEVVCNVSYHFNKHGARYGSVSQLTYAAQRYFRQNRHLAVLSPAGLLRLPNGSLFEADGRIVTFP